MRRLLLLGAIFLGLTGVAQANAPSVAWQQDALNAALSYWKTQGHTTPWLPGCQMTVTYAPLPDSTEAGETDNYCNIVINDTNGWIFADVLCLDLTHEVGHVMLGPDAFPNNTADPSHSTNPNNIMYPVIFDQKLPQCTAMQNKEYPSIPHSNAGVALGSALSLTTTGRRHQARRYRRPSR